MSGKAASRRPANKFKLPFVGQSETEITPRPLEEITAEYSKLVSQLGQAEYQRFVFEAEVNQLQQKLLSLNHEAAKRNELDKKAKEESSDVQS